MVTTLSHSIGRVEEAEEARPLPIAPPTAPPTLIVQHRKQGPVLSSPPSLPASASDAGGVAVEAPVPKSRYEAILFKRLGDKDRVIQQQAEEIEQLRREVEDLKRRLQRQGDP